ncbi:MAG: STAS domain-containing protein [Ilumatobacteraceae bacterium]
MNEPSGPLTISVVDGIVSAVGEIDAHTAGQLSSALAGRAAEDVVVDLSGVTFLDSSGLRVLLAERQDHADAGTSLFLRAPSGPVRRVLELSGLAAVFEPYDA